MAQSDIIGRFSNDPATEALRLETLVESPGRPVRRAARVISRILRSSADQDEVLRERIRRAITVVNNTRQTETAFLQSQPLDGARRIASRILKRLEVRSQPKS